MNESIKRIITCKWCNCIVDEPVFLPCSETVCKKHSIEIGNKTCKFCDRIHELKELDVFPANKAVQDLLELRIMELNFGPNHKNAYDRVNELNSFINDYNSLNEHPDEHVFEHFSKQRNIIDLAREKLIFEINQTSDRLISEIDSQEKECKAKMSKCNIFSITDDLTKIKADLSKWEKDVRYLVVNDNLWTSISKNCSMHLEALNTSRSAVEEKVFGNFKKLKSEKDVSDTFIKQLTT
jgi:hypothetical protein